MTCVSYSEPANTLSTHMVPTLHHAQELRPPESCLNLREAGLLLVIFENTCRPIPANSWCAAMRHRDFSLSEQPVFRRTVAGQLRVPEPWSQELLPREISRCACVVANEHEIREVLNFLHPQKHRQIFWEVGGGVWNGVHSASWGQLRNYLNEKVAAQV
jgi:hypothetical protein